MCISTNRIFSMPKFLLLSFLAINFLQLSWAVEEERILLNKEGNMRRANKGPKRGNRTAASQVFLNGEADRWAEATDEAAAKGYSLAGFYHTSSWQKHFKEVIEEQVLLMEGKRPLHFMEGDYPTSQSAQQNKSKAVKVGNLLWGPRTWAGVLNFVKFLHINVAGKDKNDLQIIEKIVKDLGISNQKKIRFNFNETIDRGAFSDASASRKAELSKNWLLSAGEAATSMMMHDYCTAEKSAGRKAFVFYLHNKGGCCARSSEEPAKAIPVASWREVMNTFNIEFPSICLRALMDGYSTCGMEYQERHFSGNFYWANCDHIAALPQLSDRFDAWAVEFTPFRVSKNEDTSKIYAENCGYSMHKCRGVNHYDHECPRDTYRKKIFEYVNNKELPLNPVSTSGPPGEDLSVSNSTAVAAAQRQWVREVCPPLREKPFQETTFWNDGPMSFPIKRTRKSLYDKKED